MYDSAIIANNIKSQAKVKGITIKELLSQCHLGINTVSKLALGTDIHSKNLAKIADCLDCSVDYLLGRTDDPNLYIKTRYELIKNMSIQDMAAAIAEIASDCRYCGDGCSDCDGGCLSCIEDKLQAKSSI